MTRGWSRTAATSKMVCSVIIVNGRKPLTIITKRSILDVAAVIDQPLLTVKDRQIWSWIQHHLYLPDAFQIVEKKWKLDILGVFFDILDILSEWITCKKVVIWEQFWKFIFFSARLSKINNFGYWSPKPQASRRAYLSCPVIEMMLNCDTLFSSIFSIRFFLADLVFVILKVSLQSIF